VAPRRPATRRRSASAARRVPPGGCRANASPEERRELIFVLDRSSGSRLGRILPIQDHDLCSWSRPQRLEVVIVLKPPFGPGRCIAVPIVLCRLAQDSVVRVGAPPAVNWLTSFAASGCAAAATPRRKSGRGTDETPRPVVHRPSRRRCVASRCLVRLRILLARRDILFSFRCLADLRLAYSLV